MSQTALSARDAFVTALPLPLSALCLFREAALGVSDLEACSPPAGFAFLRGAHTLLGTSQYFSSKR